MDRFTMMRDWPALDEDNEYILEVDGRLSADASLTSFFDYPSQETSSPRAPVNSLSAPGMSSHVAADDYTLIESLREETEQSNSIHNAQYHQGNELPAVAGKLPIPSSSRKDKKDPRIAHKVSQKKYRESVDVKIKLLRQIVPESRKLTKPSVLQKTIEYIHHLKKQNEELAMKSRPVAGVSS